MREPSPIRHHLGNVLAPVLLPLFSLLTLVLEAPAPVMEWELVEHKASSCIIDLKLAVMSEAEVSKLSLVPKAMSTNLSITASHIASDDHWIRDDVLSWMWLESPRNISVELNIDWDHFPASDEDAAFDVAWEHVVDGKRSQWTLGTVRFPRSRDTVSAQPAQDMTTGKRVAVARDESTASVTLHIDNVSAGSFVKWTEYIPEGCTCDVTDDSGASLRKALNTQIFLWFHADSASPMRPQYTMNCAHPIEESTFDGTLEVAFGTQTKTTDIAQTVWTEFDSLLNETMRLTQPSDLQSDASNLARNDKGGSASAPATDVAFAVQLLANHRDLSQEEWSDVVGYQGRTHTIRHEGWHKHLTDDVPTYSDARVMRSDIWKNTAATDAFVTASLEGERITVQEALLISNQTWIP